MVMSASTVSPRNDCRSTLASNTLAAATPGRVALTPSTCGRTTRNASAPAARLPDTALDTSPKAVTIPVRFAFSLPGSKLLRPMKSAVKAAVGRRYTSRGGPCWMMRPDCISTIVSDMDIASSWSCVTKIVVMPSDFTSWRISTRIASRSLASRLLSGSSRSSSLGSLTSARANATRCCWPPLRCGDGRSAKSCSLTSDSAFITRGRTSRDGVLIAPCTSGKATLSNTLKCGQIAYDWNTMPRLRRLAGTKTCRSLAKTATPSISIVPDVGVSRPATHCSVVVLPHPLGPSSVKNSPRPTSNEMPSTAGAGALPSRAGNCLVKLRTDSTRAPQSTDSVCRPPNWMRHSPAVTLIRLSVRAVQYCDRERYFV